MTLTPKMDKTKQLVLELGKKNLGLPVEKRREREKIKEEEEEEEKRRRIREKQGMKFCMELVRICMDTCLEV